MLRSHQPCATAAGCTAPEPQPFAFLLPFSLMLRLPRAESSPPGNPKQPQVQPWLTKYKTQVLRLRDPPSQLRRTLNMFSVVGNTGKGSQGYFGEATCEAGIDPSAPVWSLLFEAAKPASLCLTVAVGCFICVNVPFSKTLL